jgi:hypothetical protein
MHIVKDEEKTPKFIHLKDFIEDEEILKTFDVKLTEIPKEVLLNFATKCVLTNYLYYNHIFKNCCGICDKEMNDEDRTLMKSTDFLVVCKEHRESALCYQVDKERERLGFKKRIIV